MVSSESNKLWLWVCFAIVFSGNIEIIYTLRWRAEGSYGHISAHRRECRMVIVVPTGSSAQGSY